MILRQAMLLSVMLTNCETWLRLNKKDLEKLESVDRLFLRKILQTFKVVAAKYVEEFNNSILEVISTELPSFLRRS